MFPYLAITIGGTLGRKRTPLASCDAALLAAASRRRVKVLSA